MKPACDATVAVTGPAKVFELAKPVMGAEDFSYMLGLKQGAYIMPGAKRERNDLMLHHPAYDFNGAMLTTGASWATPVERQFSV